MSRNGVVRAGVTCLVALSMPELHGCGGSSPTSPPPTTPAPTAVPTSFLRTGRTSFSEGRLLG